MTYDMNKAFLADTVYLDVKDQLRIGAIFESPDKTKWSVVDTRSDPATDYQGALFKNEDTGQYVFASRGTASFKDGANDFEMGVGLLPDQMAVQREFFARAKNAVLKNGGDPTSIDLVWHSLGGSLIQALAVENPQNKADTFNAYGVANLIATQAGALYDNITNHVMRLDGISVLPGSSMIGKTLVYGPSTGLNDKINNLFPIGALGPLGLLADVVSSAFDGVSNHLMSNFLKPEVAASEGTPATIQPSKFGNQLVGVMESIFEGLAKSVVSTEQFFYQLQVNLENLFSSIPEMASLSGDPATGLLWPTDTFDALAADAAKAGAVAPPRNVDPLALDLDGDGLETVGTTTNSRVLFDHNHDGVKTGTGWLKSDDGWLVLDRNGNGTIDSGRELFGVDTLKNNGKLASNGFDALRDMDTNADGKIDAMDAVFSNLKIWRDLNQDGVSQAEELTSLADQQITSIGLGATTGTKNLGNGNTQTAWSTFTRANDGASGTIANLDLVNDTFYS